MFDIISGIDAVSASLKRAGALGSGARFFTCALQVNPHAYVLRHPKDNQPFAAASQEDYDAAMVEAARDAGVEVVAITDHFRVDTSESLRTAFEAAGIVVFPGFEACSSEGVHLLCLHQPGTTLDRLQSLIGECRLRDPDEPSPQSQLGCEDIMRLTADRGGLTIAAHVTHDNGLLEHMNGGSRIAPWTSPHLAAAAIPWTVETAPQAHREILQNRDPKYRRDPPLALLNAADVSDPSGFSREQSWSRIKMARPTIDGLRQAFLSADSRLRLSSEALTDDSTEIAAIAWDGGFLDGQAIRLNNGLNVLIGGRGAGKSLVIESLRHAMGCDVAGTVAQANHKALMQKVLGPSAKVSVVLRDPPPSRKWHIVERTGSAPPVVRGSNGAIIPGLQPLALVDGLEIYGQHELSELTRNKELLAGLLARYIQDREGEAARRAETLRQLAASREDIGRRIRDIDRLEEETANLATLRHKLEKMDELGAREMLKEKLDFEQAYGAAIGRRTALDGLRGRAVSLQTDLRELPDSHPDPEGNRTIAQVSRVGGDQVATLVRTIEEAMTATEAEISAFDAERPKLAARQRPVEEQLRQAGVDAATYEQIASGIKNLEDKADSLVAMRTALVGVQEERERLLTQWTEQNAHHLRASARAARKAGRALKGRVRVSIRQSDDLSELLTLLKTRVSGAGPQNTVDRIMDRDEVSFRALASAIRSGEAALRDQFRLTDVAARNVASGGEALALEVEELAQSPAANVELNVGEDGVERWKAIDDLSAGQKATAVLLLLLSGSVSPLVIDQPEDDLDNRFIADTIVETMRREKRHRQFIFSSHNANIPVLGDAEQIVTLRPGVDDGREHSLVSEAETGSLDQFDVRAAVERLLEGGRAAFELRRAKYGY